MKMVDVEMVIKEYFAMNVKKTITFQPSKIVVRYAIPTTQF